MTYDLQNVSFRYSGAPTDSLHHISAVLPDKGVVVLVGPNGSGKSTLVRLLAGLDFPTEGELSYHQKTMSRQNFSSNQFSNYYRDVGVVPQIVDYLFLNESVMVELGYGLQQLGIDDTEIQQRVLETAKRFNIEQLLPASPLTLSVGQRKIVAVAMMSITKPAVLLLDEPFAGVSTENQQLIRSFLTDYGQQHLVVIAHHRFEEIKDITNQIILLNKNHELTYVGTDLKQANEF